MKRILLSGGSGLLGEKLLELLPSIFAPTHQEMDVTFQKSIENAMTKYHPQIFIHCAALVGTRQCKADLLRCLKVNVYGTLNVVRTCIRNNVRLVYISTEYVFDGKRGNYTEEDLINPLGEYAKSKAAGEIIVGWYTNSLIIRSAFCSDKEWKFEGAFTDQYTSRDTVEIIAPDILRAAISDLTGIIHIGTERKSQYELAQRRDPCVKAISIKGVELPLPIDTSLNCGRWNKYKAAHKIR